NYVLLAREGMVAPEDPFEGQWGVWSQIGADDPTFEGFEPFEHNDRSFKITQMSQKLYPCHHHGIAAIVMATELGNKPPRDDTEAINTAAYHRALSTGGAGPDKPQRRDPQTREDADHSIPWLVAVALRDGTLTPRSFDPPSLLDPALRPI